MKRPREGGAEAEDGKLARLDDEAVDEAGLGEEPVDACEATGEAAAGTGQGDEHTAVGEAAGAAEEVVEAVDEEGAAEEAEQPEGAEEWLEGAEDEPLDQEELPQEPGEAGEPTEAGQDQAATADEDADEPQPEPEPEEPAPEQEPEPEPASEEGQQEPAEAALEPELEAEAVTESEAAPELEPEPELEVDGEPATVAAAGQGAEPEPIEQALPSASLPLRPAAEETAGDEQLSGQEEEDEEDEYFELEPDVPGATSAGQYDEEAEDWQALAVAEMDEDFGDDSDMFMEESEAGSSSESEDDDEEAQVALTCQKLATANRALTGLLYSKQMKGHRDTSAHPEQPSRISRIYHALVESGLAEQCVRISCRDATVLLSEEELFRLGTRYNSVYFNQLTTQCALLSAGSVIEATSVHHGNGTQRMFEEDPSVLYFSAHRFDQGTFYPGGAYGDYTSVGVGEGEGYSINVPWPCGMMGDQEYYRAFEHVLMPIAREFKPDLVLISAGFDAARGDPLGGCDITAGGYAQLTKMLMDLAGGRIVLALEGGYNLNSISQSVAACTSALLGHDVGELERGACRHDAQRVIGRVRHHLLPYWKSLMHWPCTLDASRMPQLAAPLVSQVRHVFVWGYWELQLRGLVQLDWMNSLCEGMQHEPATVKQATLQLLHAQPHTVLLASAAAKSYQLQGFLLSMEGDSTEEEFYERLTEIDGVQGYPGSCQRIVIVAESASSQTTLAYLHYNRFAPAEALKDGSIGGHCLSSGSWASHVASMRLESAIRSGNLGGMKDALSQGADPDFADSASCSLLLVLSQASRLSGPPTRLEAVKLLLSHKANPGHDTRCTFAPLHVASSRGHLEVVRVLLEASASADVTSDDGVTPLWLAALNGHTAVVQALVAAGASVNAAALNGSTPAHAAAAGGRLNTLILLGDLGARIDTPASKGYQAVVAALARMGADTSGEVRATQLVEELSGLSQQSSELRQQMLLWRKMLQKAQPQEDKAGP